MIHQPHPNQRFHLCHYNKAQAIALLDSPQLSDFLAARSLYRESDGDPGFIWRLEDPDDATGSSLPFDDCRTIVGLSVWKNLRSLRSFTYGRGHAAVMRKRRRWFKPHEAANYVLWWQPADRLPTVEDGEARLQHLQKHGATRFAFDFHQPHAAPSLLIGTLGPAGTNSEKAAGQYVQRKVADAQVQLFDTFEEVADKLVDDSLDLGVVCTAYLKFSALYFERATKLKLIESFVADLHPMVIAGLSREVAEKKSPTCACQPAILPLIRPYLRGRQIVEAASNASAAHDVTRGLVDVCLTTRVAAEACGLAIFVEMPPLQIPFVVVGRSSAGVSKPENLADLLA